MGSKVIASCNVMIPSSGLRGGGGYRAPKVAATIDGDSVFPGTEFLGSWCLSMELIVLLRYTECSEVVVWSGEGAARRCGGGSWVWNCGDCGNKRASRSIR